MENESIKQVTFNDILRLDADLANFDIEQVNDIQSLTPKEILEKICKLYNAIKPIIDWLLKIIPMPDNIKRIVDALIGILERICAV